MVNGRGFGGGGGGGGERERERYSGGMAWREGYSRVSERRRAREEGRASSSTVPSPPTHSQYILQGITRRRVSESLSSN